MGDHDSTGDAFWDSLSQVSFDLLPSRLELLRFQQNKNTLALVDIFYHNLDALLSKSTLCQSLPLFSTSPPQTESSQVESREVPVYKKKSIRQIMSLYKEFVRLGDN